MDRRSLIRSAHAAESNVDTVLIVTEALTERFGAQALRVAERQFVSASNESRHKWREIVSRLTPDAFPADLPSQPLQAYTELGDDTAKERRRPIKI